MNIEEIDQQIEKTHSGIADLVSELDIIKRALIVDAKIFFPKWFEETAKNTIRDNATVVNAMPEDRIVAFKADLNKIILDAPDLIDLELGTPQLWPHEADVHTITLYSYTANNKRDVWKDVDRPLRNITGHLGELLHKYNLAVLRSGYWQREKVTTEARILAHYNYYKPPLDQRITQYTTRFNVLVPSAIKLADLLKIREQEEALNKFERA